MSGASVADRPADRCAQGAAKGLTTVALPETVLLGIDMTGVQLFDGRTRALIDGEGYPYHLIRSWSWHQVRLFPSGPHFDRQDSWLVVCGSLCRLSRGHPRCCCGSHPMVVLW